MPDPSLLSSLLSRLGVKVPTAPAPDPLTQALYDQQARAQQGPVASAMDWAGGHVPGFVKGLVSGDVLPSKAQLSADPSYGYGALAGAMLPFGEKAIPGMYSRLERLVESLPSTINAGKLNNILNGGRVAKEELSWRKVPEFLQDYLPNKAVPRDVLMEHLQQNPLDVKTIEKAPYTPNTTTYDNYVMPGATNYRETLLQLTKPDAKGVLQSVDEGLLSADPGASASTDFHSHHWDEPNVLVHVRHNERTLPLPANTSVEGPLSPVFGPDPAFQQQIRQRMAQGLTGPKGRMIENIQSDWEQRGAHGGYTKEAYDPKKDTQATHNLGMAESDLLQLIDTAAQALTGKPYAWNGESLSDAGGFVSRSLANHLHSESPHPDAQELYDRLQQARVALDNAHDAAARSSREQVPDMPFKGMSVPPTLALKQQLLDIAHNAPQTQWIGIAPSSELRNRREVISPEFQDKMLPSLLEKLLKPFGGTVEQADLGIKPKSLLRDSYPELQNPAPNLRAPIARLTPEMLQQIKEKGFPLLLATLAARGLMPSHPQDQR